MAGFWRDSRQGPEFWQLRPLAPRVHHITKRDFAELKGTYATFKREREESAQAMARDHKLEMEAQHRNQDVQTRRILDEIQKVERALTKGDQAQDILRGLQALAVLIKEAKPSDQPQG